MVDAILHTATRVVRRLTTDPAHVISTDESKQAVPADFDLAGGPWVLNVDGTRRVATPAEDTQAFTVPLSLDMQALADALSALETATAATVLDRVKVFAAKYRAIVARPRRME